ncbi:hypothetical protein OAC05_06770, partial [Planktomarina temperata]|nr:hypothetical protein [Planktomarina temperata]
TVLTERNFDLTAHKLIVHLTALSIKEILDIMAGPGSYAHAVVGEAESFDRAAHTVTIMENDLAPMAIVAFEIGLICSDKIARDPSARADRAKIGHPG